MHPSELKFVEDTYVNCKPIHDEIVAINVLVLLCRAGVIKIDAKDSKIGYNKGEVDKIIKEQSWTKNQIGNVSLQPEQFIGAYSFILEMKTNMALIPQVASRPITESEQKLSLAQNSHKASQQEQKQAPKVISEPQQWINEEKAKAKMGVQLLQNHGPIAVVELGEQFSEEDD